MPFVLNITRVSAEQESRAAGGPHRLDGGASSGRRSAAKRWLSIALLLGGLMTACSERRVAPKARSAAKTTERRAPAVEARPPAAAALPSAPPSRSEASSRRSGGTLRVHLEAEPPHLNPLQDGYDVVDRAVGRLVYEPLVECRDRAVLPALAERWETSPDGLRLVLFVRPGVRFHDEQAFTVVDAQATLEAVLRSTSRVPLLRATLAAVAAVEIAPERQVRLRLHRPAVAAVLRALCEVPMLPEGALREGQAAFAALGRQPNGTGPFRFVGWERGRRIKLQRNRLTWGPAPPLDEIVFEIDSDGTRALARTRRGELDVLPRLLDVHYPDQVLPAALGDRVQLWKTTPERYSFVAVNTRRPPLSDPRLRRALSLLWNRTLFAQDLHRGLAQPIGAPSFADVPAPPFSPREAASQLEASGYRDTNGDGVREFEGRPVRFSLLQPTGSKGFATEARKFALELRKVGLLVDLVNADPAALSSRMGKGDFDLAPARWEGHVDEDPGLLYGADGPFNMTGHRSEVVETLLGQLRTTEGAAARAALYQRLGEALAADAPSLFLYRHEQLVLVARRVQGLSAPAGELDLRAVWLDPP